MSGRGGARHHAKPYVDTGILYKCLEKHEGLLSEMGAYEHISRNMAPDPKGLLHTMPLWREFLRVEPSGEIHSQPLRAALLSFLTEKPSLNHTNHSGQVWCNLKLERLTCMLAHVRKVGRDSTCLTPIAAKLTRLEYNTLMDALKLMQLPVLEKEGDAEAKALEKVKGSDGRCEKNALEKAEGERKKKKLKQQSSEVSMDSKGFPTMFDTSPEPLEKGKLPASSSKPISTLRPGQRLGKSLDTTSVQEKLGYIAKKPAAAAAPGLEKPKAKGKAKPKPKALGKAVRKAWVKLRQTNANNPKRAYLQGCTDGGKVHLIVEVTEKRCPKYLQVVEKIKTALEKDALTKAEAIQLRDDLCDKFKA